jgi:predicted membrane-bound mannosyltransferase
MKHRGWELLGWTVLVAAALAVRLIGLADRPFHHDESQDAYFSWLFFTSGDYTYRPILHGPLRFYLTAGMFGAFGDSDFTARLAPALMGTLMVPLAALLRGQLGRIAALSAGIALAFGPSYLYYSRFAREDIYIACITLALLAVTFRFLQRPRRHQPALIGALLALSFATKESTFITVFVAGTFFIAALAVQARRHGWRDAPLVRAITAVGWEPWAWALAAFAAVFTLLFTVFLTNPAGLWDGIHDGLAYWLAQHGPGRGEKEWYFYIVVLFAEEWPALVLGAVGAVATLRRPTLLTLLLLAGVGVQAIWEARRRWARAVGLTAVAACALYAGYASWTANVEHGADPREFLVTTQSAEQVKGVRDEVRALTARAQREGRDVQILVDAAEGATFPWAWYFRDLPAGYLDLTKAPFPSDTDVAILTEGNRNRLLGDLAGYDGRRFPFRVWWVRDYSKMSADAWWRWFTRREPWSPTGGMPEWLYVRQGA